MSKINLPTEQQMVVLGGIVAMALGGIIDYEGHGAELSGKV